MGQCQKKEEKLPKNAKVKNLIANWDILNISVKIMDTVSCFVPHEQQQKKVFRWFEFKKMFAKAL